MWVQGKMITYHDQGVQDGDVHQAYYKKAFSAILVVAFSGPIFGPFLVPEPLGPIGNLTKAKNQGKSSQECLEGIANSRSPWQHRFSCFSDFFCKVEKRFAVFFLRFFTFWSPGPRAMSIPSPGCFSVLNSFLGLNASICPKKLGASPPSGFFQANFALFRGGVP